jgi:hypothetical protein
MNESIYSLVPQEVHVEQKPKMYRSSHHPQSSLSGSTIGIHGTTRLPGAGEALKKTFAEFGPKGSCRPDPSVFLKSGQRCTGVIPTSNPSGFVYEDTSRKPSVPRRDEKPVLGLKTNKNFITSNAVDVILQVPQKPNFQEPNYLTKPDYGKVPEYLNEVKEEIWRENKMIDEYVAEIGRIQGVGRSSEEEESLEQFADEERAELLKNLKRKWDAVNAKYQTMCHQVKLDTVGKIKRKETLEKELDQLEADIKKLAARGSVYVSNGY